MCTQMTKNIISISYPKKYNFITLDGSIKTKLWMAGINVYNLVKL